MVAKEEEEDLVSLEMTGFLPSLAGVCHLSPHPGTGGGRYRGSVYILCAVSLSSIPRSPCSRSSSSSSSPPTRNSSVSR